MKPKIKINDEQGRQLAPLYTPIGDFHIITHEGAEWIATPAGLVPVQELKMKSARIYYLRDRDGRPIAFTKKPKIKR